MSQPRLGSPHTFCCLNLLSTSALFPLCHSCPPESRPTTTTTSPAPAGLQGDLRNWGQRTSMPTPHCAVVKNKRGPGRPRKHPLPSPSHAKLAMPLGDLVPEAEGEAEEVVPEKRGGGGNTAQQVMDLVSQASRKRGRKRKHGDSPCHQR